MNNSDKIKTIKKNNTSKFKEKGSAFLGFAYNASTQESANSNLKNLKKEFYDATHHCYAYKLSSGEEKYSDDGEPNGTAGLRILNSINHFNLTNILVVVVRYFGGTKLGVGPLGKAYFKSAFEVLESSHFIELTKFQQIGISYSYDDTSKIHHLIKKFGCKKISEKFDKSPKITCYLEPSKISILEAEVTNLTQGKSCLILKNEEIYLEVT
ncbi:MAG: YigZ family protein [Melioribacteraceae bacterium]